MDNELNNNFITMDIETINNNNSLIPYLICAYNGKEYIESFSDYSEGMTVIQQAPMVRELFKDFIIKLLKLFKKCRKLTVYAYNSSSFDYLYLLKHLLDFGK